MSYKDWNNGPFNKPFYFFFYYLSKKNFDKSVISNESNMFREYVWQFKNGTNESVTQDAIKVVSDCINQEFTNVDDTIFVCIPASNHEKTTLRFKNFSAGVCQKTGLIDGFGHIQDAIEHEAKHISHQSVTHSYVFDENIFANKKVILFDDVVTQGNSMLGMIRTLESINNCQVIACMSLGQTYYNLKYGTNKVAHPYSGNDIFTGERVL